MGHMTRFERRLAVRTLDALTPPLAGAPPPSQLDADRFLEDFLGNQRWPLRLGVRALFAAFALGPLFVVGRPRLFPNLTPELRERYYDRWYTSRFYLLRVATLTFKSLLGLVWCGHPDVQRALGYHKPNALPPVDRVAAR